MPIPFTLRDATKGDLGEIVRLHLSSFPGFFMTELGPSFLREYYKTVTSYPAKVFRVLSAPDGVAGFAAGFLNASAFYRFLRRRRLSIGLALFPALVRRPARVFRVIHDYRKRDGSADGEAPTSAVELASIAVAPSSSGAGLGAALIADFMDSAAAMGASMVFLTTDAEANDSVNRFYVKNGFVVHRQFTSPPHRQMFEYRRDLRNLEP